MSMLADALELQLVENKLDLLVAPDGNLEACILVARTTATKRNISFRKQVSLIHL